MATPFLMKLMIKTYIECFSISRILPDLLKEEEGLGVHTSILTLCPSFGLEYFWCHKSLRPLGELIPLQCPKCAVLRSMTFTTVGQRAGTYKALCPCGLTVEKDAKIADAKLPQTADGSITGWGSRLWFGSPVAVSKAWDAPRSAYNVS